MEKEGTINYKLIILFVIFALFVFFTYRSEQKMMKGTNVQEGKGLPLPDLIQLDYVNKKYPVDDKLPYVLIAFGTYCPPCRALIPTHARNAEKYKGKLNYIAIASETASAVEDHIQENREMKNYNVAVESRSNKEISTLMGTLGVRGIPAGFIFNADHKLTWYGHPGSNNFYKEIEKVISAGSENDWENIKSKKHVL